MSNKLEFDEIKGRELIQRARDLHSFLQKSAPVSEENRRVGDNVIAQLVEAELMKVAVPYRWGGLGVSAWTMAQIAVEIAKGDPSAAWVFCISNSCSWVASLGPDALQEAFFADGVPIACSAVNPPGSFKPVDGGYIVNGAWPYASGCHNSSWGMFGVGGKDENGHYVPGGNVFVKMSEVTIQDTWHVAGLKGTGSNTVVAKDLFVPEHMRVPVDKASGPAPGKKHFGEPSDYFPFLPHLRTTMLGVMVGMAEGALESLIPTTKTKPIIYTTYARQSDSHVVQKEIGEAAAMIHAARVMLKQCNTTTDEAALAKRQLTYAEQTENRAETAYATDILVKAVDKLMYVGGSGVFADKYEIQRFWRDLNTAARHAANNPNVGYEIYGRALMGVEPNIAPNPAFI
jgi:alkylation response protein AidB-like acyl-CoA dehydrogenase